MSCGVPVIASAAGGLSELVEDGVSGLLVTPGDIGSLAANLGYLLRNPDLRAGMGTRARERICAQFQVQRMVRDFLILYDLLLHD
jgi:glycosyltransferase involved in cell wall biosynthesis